MAVRSVEPESAESPADAFGDGRDERAPLAPQLVRATCRIVRWRGYVTSEFHVVDEDGSVLAVSPAFRWRGPKPPPESASARAAYDTLVAQVLDAGWTPAGRGPQWFAARFLRDVPAPVPPPDVEVAVEPAWTWEPAAPRPRPPAPSVSRAAAAPVATSGPPADSEDGVVSAAARQGRRGRILALATLPFAIGLLVYVLVGYDAHHASGSPRSPLVAERATPPKAPAKSPRSVSPKRVAAVVPAPVQQHAARLDLVGIGTSATWLEARRGSSAGPILFSGMLQPGQALHFRSSAIWVRFGGASDVRVLLNGARIELEGTLARVFR